MKLNHFIMSLILAIVLLFSACKKDTAQFGTKQPNPPPGNSVNAYNNRVETQPAKLIGVKTTVNANIGGYYAATPALYDSTDKKYPLLVFLHGVSELGNGTTDLPQVLYNGVPRLLNQKKFPPTFTVSNARFSFIVISPQFKAWPKSSDVNALLNHIIEKYRIDTTRMYVSGLSMGGGVTWDCGVDITERLAAIVPICGAAWTEDQYCAKMAAANLPIWAFHNEDDPTVGAGSTIGTIEKVNSRKPTPLARMTLWPKGGHDSWTKATNPEYREEGKNMYEWMLQYTTPRKK